MNSPVYVSIMAMVCGFACRLHPGIFISASFAPSLFGSNRKVYSGGREADLVMSSATSEVARDSVKGAINAITTPANLLQGSSSPNVRGRG